MKINAYVYDFEVFAYDWLVVFKDIVSKEYTVIHNDNQAVKDFLCESDYYIGFNSKHYDQYIMKAVSMGFSPEQVKAVNDYIINGGQGWEFPPMKNWYFSFNNVDIRDDMQAGLSLKAIEGHLGMNIKESSIPFDLDRPLTKEELEETIRYCKHDVDTTEELVKLRGDYLTNKESVGRLAKIDPIRSLTMTNAKLTAAMLKAELQEYTDERDYKFPTNIKTEFIPHEVFAFFDRLHDKNISDEDVFSEKLELHIGDCPVTLGYGGIHGALANYQGVSTDKRIIRNFDVSSYYPHLMILYNYISRNIPDPQIFKDIVSQRMEAKQKGNKALANALKLVINTTYGAMLNPYNALYDPLMGRSVCITGQIFLLELAEHLHKNISDLRIVQINTDGIAIEFNVEDYTKVIEITDEWQDRTGFTLEEDVIDKIYQKDVNNYLAMINGEAKTKGGYLVRGIAKAGAFNINNNARIVAKALKQYFIDGTPLEETINSCDDPFMFQMIAKAGAKYKEAYQDVNGEKIPIQKVNRIFASKDKSYGKLYKIKAENDSVAKIEKLPEHCLIDNENTATIDEIDKMFYIEMAKKQLNDFLGDENKMATTTKKTTTTNKPTNVYQKLNKARQMFLERGVQKTGKNMTIRYKYFELDDIVPAVTDIFNEIGLLSIVSFSETEAYLHIVDTDIPESEILFCSPMRFPTENKAVNPVQSLGAAQTYLRRYLYLLALDICEPDILEPQTEKTTETKVNKAPTTAEERQEIKENLTQPDDKASELQIKQLKKVLKELIGKKPDLEEEVSRIAVESESFKTLSKTKCEEIITWASEQIKEGD